MFRLHCLTQLLLRTIDYAVKIRVNPDQKGVDLNVKHSMVRARSVTRHFVS